ncbi:hypothetical protein C7N43_29405 [Sphingobacteriales bacterium UPWRP_1]|nr:hypothetical protein BVG80_03300 [Sphingobacteriales bacterium TSM_CSM]PSJ73392.1 hypothetical protein C7N43_29405 [Sphingobacteriales bacterium UPWRP_1]
MKTTDLFVELVVIGMGLFINLLLLCVLLFGYDWLQYDVIPAASLLPVIAVIYVLGIVFDRCSDNFTRNTDSKIRTSYFSDSKEFLLARDNAFDASDSIKSLHDYNRSRMRICRSWFIYWGMMAILAPVAAWLRMPDVYAKKGLMLCSFLLFALLAFVTRYAWVSLTHGYYSRLYDYWRLHGR